MVGSVSVISKTGRCGMSENLDSSSYRVSAHRLRFRGPIWSFVFSLRQGFCERSYLTYLIVLLCYTLPSPLMKKTREGWVSHTQNGSGEFNGIPAEYPVFGDDRERDKGAINCPGHEHGPNCGHEVSTPCRQLLIP